MKIILVIVGMFVSLILGLLGILRLCASRVAEPVRILLLRDRNRTLLLDRRPSPSVVEDAPDFRREKRDSIFQVPVKRKKLFRPSKAEKRTSIEIRKIEIKKKIIKGLENYGKRSENRTSPEENAIKGFSKSETGLAKDCLYELIEAGLLRTKKSNGNRHVYLAPKGGQASDV